MIDFRLDDELLTEPVLQRFTFGISVDRVMPFVPMPTVGHVGRCRR